MNDTQDKRGDLTARLWLFLLKQGGRWQAGDVSRSVLEPSVLVSRMLGEMSRTGNVRQYEVPGMARRFSYGVTGDCKVPRVVRVQDVADCLMTQPDEEGA
jgi:hypothetical protein